MARQLRIEYEGAFYYITSRWNLRGDIFFDDKDQRGQIFNIDKVVLKD
jgi:hypothetical protein